MTPTVRQVRPLLQYIQRHEAPKGYNQVWGGIRSIHHPPRPLTAMTIGQVLAWQDSIDHLYMSEAAGAYQVMEDTLREYYAPAGLTLDTQFNEATQDAFAVYLMKRRGLLRYLRGEWGADKLANALAYEWASLPFVSGPKKGRGAYDGDGLNKAVKDISGYLRAVEAVMQAPKDYDEEPQKESWLWGKFRTWLTRVWRVIQQT